MRPLAIIPAFSSNAGDVAMLDKCLSSLRRTVGDACDVLVVDDCSPDKEAAQAGRRLTELNDGLWLENKQNVGFSHTVNVGLRQAIREERDAILVNADIEFLTDTWLDLMVKQPTEDGKGLASVVGALLLYPNMTIQHAGIYFCSPGDEPILTVQDGYVPIAQLSERDHGLVSYARKEHRIFRCATDAGRRMPGSGRRSGGYEFERGVRNYCGEMLGIETAKSIARVTPNHKLTAHWGKEALASWAVYIMRRGNDWRVGHTKMAHGGVPGERGWAFGPRLRMDQQRADGIWILSLHHSKEEANKQEQALAWEFGVPTWQFTTRGMAGLSQEAVDELWHGYESESLASYLLEEFGRDITSPLMVARRIDGRRRLPVGPSRRFEITAANLMPGLMTIPVDPGHGQHPTMAEFAIQREKFDGQVYSLEVYPHHAYVSGGVVLGNSILYREFDHRFRYGPHNLPEARHAMVMPVTGALQFIRHECLMEVGVYDETFRMGWEDVDYNVRVWQAGKECIYQPGIRAIHHEGVFRGAHRKSKQVEEWQAASWHRFKTKWADTSFTEFIPSLI